MARLRERKGREGKPLAVMVRDLAGARDIASLSAADEDREGYVPNVVYTCGALKHGKQLFLPYGVADSSVTFAFVEIADLLADLG